MLPVRSRQTAPTRRCADRAGHARCHFGNAGVRSSETEQGTDMRAIAARNHARIGFAGTIHHGVGYDRFVRPWYGTNESEGFMP